MARVAGGFTAAGLPAVPADVLAVCSPDGSFHTGGFFGDPRSPQGERRRAEWLIYREGKAEFWREFVRVGAPTGLTVSEAWRRAVREHSCR